MRMSFAAVLRAAKNPENLFRGKRSWLPAFAFATLISACCTSGQTVIFRQAHFPAIDTQPVPDSVLAAAVGGSPVFASIDQLREGSVLKGASLLVLPYGSAFPVDAWPSIQNYLQLGGNLLLLGGQPLRVPVSATSDGTLSPGVPQESYSRAIGLLHSYAVPALSTEARFHWRHGYSFLPSLDVHAVEVFAEEGRLQGLGYFDTADGTHLSAPVIFADRLYGLAHSRIVALPFNPAPGFWDSSDGEALLHIAAQYAIAGATNLSIEAHYSAIRPGEAPQLTLHLRRKPAAHGGFVDVQLTQGNKLLNQAHLPAAQTDISIPFRDALPSGVYRVTATFTADGASTAQEFAENGFEVEDLSALEAGDALGVKADFLTLGGKPFFPFGANYFTTEENGWDFSGSRNGTVWEHDFADMESHNVNLVRTGVWMSTAKFLDPTTGAANERFLRNLEAFLAAAHRHHIAVNFTFFAFTPRMTDGSRASADSSAAPPPANPYLDALTLEAEKAYIVSVVQRFRNLPWLSYDLINEPSFSNPRNIFHGNVPNNDRAEQDAWHTWLQKRYSTLASLAIAWRTTSTELVDWNSIALPKPADLNFARYGNDRQVRAFDYNLFAQDSFSGWVGAMVGAIRGTGSTQLVNVGQDEGGVSDRLLNQFYATAGVSFTTNHTYWQDDALLWDSVAAKRPGMPNITGETGYQPAWDPDGTWRYDELSGAAILERKLALGFAAGSSGAMQWDWAREVDFGMQRSDGSAKIWEPMMRELGAFTRQGAPYATGLKLPEVALILPQSLQLSTRHAESMQAQQTAVRVLYQYNRVETYAVGEYQMETLGTPRLIILPSAYGLSEQAWVVIEARVRAGAILLASGPFGADEHMHSTDRAHRLGLDATLVPLQLRDDTLHLPTGGVPLHFPGLATTMLDRAALPGGKDFVALPLGKGQILFSAFPLELNSELTSVAQVYAYALKAAAIKPTYITPVKNPGILICPTQLPHATLYVLTSETETSPVSFTDTRSGKTFSGRLEAGRAALLLIGEHGDLVTSFGWRRNPQSHFPAQKR